MPPSEPTPADVAAVAAATGQTTTPETQPPAPAPPAPQPAQPPAEPPVQPPAPAPTAQTPQMQPPEPTPQPSNQTDPFASLFAEPPAPQPQPTEPTPSQPAQPEPPKPGETVPPATPPAPQPEAHQTVDEYMKSATSGLPEIPAMPDPDKIDPNDPVAIKKFFDDLVTTAADRATANFSRKEAIRTTERKLWDEAFDKYGSLRSNKKARDLVHNLRMGYFQRGSAITPLQAADILLDSMGQQYRQGVADNQVHTTIERVQPEGGGSAALPPTATDAKAALEAVQTGGEAALADILDAEIKAGRL